MTTPDPPAPAGQFPVRLWAELDPDLSRGLWIVKGLLAIPHYIVLFFLWIGFFFSSLGAFFAILFTGRFPRVLFDFNVGVMRWTWRVTYYAYGVLGTDRYPPFSLGEVADYPARLEVDYPERLSRGLVLVKWWLLALPHYLVISFFVGGGILAVDEASDHAPPLLAGGGLVGILVLIAALALLFTGEYPRPIFDLVVGLQRWVLRVAAYVALMTDQYPPFRLDQGGDADSPSAVPPPAPPTPPDRPTGTGRAATIIIGIISLVVAGVLLLTAAVLWTVKVAAPDDDGFLTAEVASCQVADSYALTSEPIRIDLSGTDGLAPQSLLGDAKVTAKARDGSALFVGVADSRQVEDYLRGTARTTIVPDTDADDDSLTVCRTVAGQAPPAPPTSLSIWDEYATGAGSQSITWPLSDGDWTVVVMKLDGSQGLDVAVDAGATFPVVNTVMSATLITGALFLLLALALLIGPATIRTIRRSSSSARTQ